MIKEFNGKYRFLSNFWECPVFHEGKVWASSEHAFQAMKTLDESEREMIRIAGNTGIAKRLGKKVTIRKDWDSVKDAIMEEIVWRKFRQNSVLRKELLRTGDEHLQEGNRWHDVHFGVDIKSGIGKNVLGLILMKTRDKLRTLSSCPHCKNGTIYKVDGEYVDCECMIEQIKILYLS